MLAGIGAQAWDPRRVVKGALVAARASETTPSTLRHPQIRLSTCLITTSCVFPARQYPSCSSTPALQTPILLPEPDSAGPRVPCHTLSAGLSRDSMGWVTRNGLTPSPRHQPGRRSRRGARYLHRQRVHVWLARPDLSGYLSTRIRRDSSGSRIAAVALSALWV
jgi:hypothetical protein